MIFRYMDCNAIAFPQKTLYFDNQKSLHMPVVQKYWQEEQHRAVEDAKSRGPINLGGDAR